MSEADEAARRIIREAESRADPLPGDDDVLTVARAWLAQQWQPIETAPRSTCVLVCGGVYRTDQDWTDDWRPFRGVTIAYLRDGDMDWRGDQLANDEFYWHRPTHWLPLPAPPEDK